MGRDGWLFYRPAVRYLIESWSPEGDQIQGNVSDAIISFREELAQRGIRLLVMPAPNKASIYPEMLAARVDGMVGPVNATTRDILAKLREADIDILDLFEVYHQANEMSGSPRYYLAQDSHWSPEGMRLAAEAVAGRLIDLVWVE